MTDLTRCIRKVNLKTKIDALDLLRNGMTISEISRKLNFSKNNLYYWMNKEANLRKEYREECAFENALSNRNNLSSHVRNLLINQNLKNKKSHRSKISPSTKLKCIDMVEKFNSKSFVSQKTGYNHSLIGKWVKNKAKIELSLTKNLFKKSNKTKAKRKVLHKKERKLKVIEDETSGLNKGEDTSLNSVSIDYKLNQPLIYQVEDPEIKQYLNCRHRKVDLQKKIDVLDMLEKGIDIQKIVRHLSLNYSTVAYWKSISTKLRNEASLVRKSIDPNWFSPSANHYRKSVINNLLKINHIDKLSIETKFAVVHWIGFFTNRPHSFQFLGDIFGIDRNVARNIITDIDQLLEKYQLRQSLRKSRLRSLLCCTDHKNEIKKLIRLDTADRGLDVLGNYLTYGITYHCSRIPFKKNTVLTNLLTERARVRRKRAEELRNRSVATKSRTKLLKTSSELVSLFRDLYREEYETLYLIDERFMLLSHQISISTGNDQKNIIRSWITELRSHLSESVKKLITLHRLMIRSS